MNGNASYPAYNLAPDEFHIGFSWQGNNTSSPDAANNRGPRGLSWSVARTGVGLYVVTLGAGFSFPAQPFAVTATTQGAVLATDRCEAMVIGETTITTTRTITVQLHRAGTAFELPATAGNRVNVVIYCSNNTGR
jgi:hypothetical protein